MGAARELVPDNEMGSYGYEPPDKRVQLNFKVPKSLKARLLGLERLWKARAKADGDDPDDITVTYVVERLLRSSVDAAWADETKDSGLGFTGMPGDDEQWEQLTAAMTRRAKTHRK